MTVTQIKAIVRERDGMRCTKCGITNDQHFKNHHKSLHVHRTTPGSDYSTEPGVCVTLCFSCHGPEPRREHGQRFKENPKLHRVIRVSKPWHAVLRKLAAKRHQPVLYLLITLAAEAAEKEGVTELPATPWDEDNANN